MQLQRWLTTLGCASPSIHRIAQKASKLVLHREPYLTRFEPITPLVDYVFVMATCDECGTYFEPANARVEYETEFGEGFDYVEDYEETTCGHCAIADSESLMNQGRAIMMMNGDEDYDDKFVEEWL
jgi:hypothetical protein